MTNYLYKVLPPQYSHVNKVYCLLAATVFCALPLCSTEAAAENILKYDGTTNIHGNAKTWAAKNEYDGIDIRVTGVDGGYYTTRRKHLFLTIKPLLLRARQVRQHHQYRSEQTNRQQRRHLCQGRIDR